jgi:hypothetical protein
MYGFPGPRPSRKAVLVFRFEDPDRALETLARRGIEVVPAEDLLVRKSS